MFSWNSHEWPKLHRKQPHLCNSFISRNWCKIWHKWPYLQNRNRLTGIENRLVVAKGEGEGGGVDWEFGISRGKLLHIGWIHNKVLLYSTGNNIQYPVINHHGKEYKKECISIHITSHFAVRQKLQHCKPTILQLKKKKKRKETDGIFWPKLGEELKSSVQQPVRNWIPPTTMW